MFLRRGRRRSGISAWPACRAAILLIAGRVAKATGFVALSRVFREGPIFPK